MSRVIVTGASGYIGGQTVLQLQDQGHTVFGVDSRSLPENLAVIDCFLQDDFANDSTLSAIGRWQPDAIIHCAGTSLVGPSVLNPRLYYDNNFVKTKKLLDFLIDSKINPRIVFSSSAAVYGEPVMTPCSELDPPLPISPYGESKLMIEQMLESYSRAYQVNYVAFRYFNACGADPQGRHGQEPGATHIIARILESIRDNQEFTLYGNNYPTTDGTCVRDYVHVDDIARAHCLAIDNTVPAGIYNLGSNTGTSNQEIIKEAHCVTNQEPKIVIGQQRAGDPAMLTASADKFNSTTGWIPCYNINEIITHAWAWYNK
jgi:UDP-glucose 4-epimerase